MPVPKFDGTTEDVAFARSTENRYKEVPPAWKETAVGKMLEKPQEYEIAPLWYAPLWAEYGNPVTSKFVAAEPIDIAEVSILP